MAYDERLAERIRELLARAAGVTEQKNMAVGVSGQGGILVRVDPAESDELVASTNAYPMEMRGRSMAGWLRVDPENVDTAKQLEPWVARGAAYARALPPKKK